MLNESLQSLCALRVLALKSETKTKEKRQRARPFQTLPEFAALNRDQLAYIHDILRTKTLEDAQREIWTELGLQTRLDLCTLHRYKHKVLLAESLDLVDDATTAVDQLNDLLAGRENNIPAAGMAVVQQRALALANDPKTKPSLFTNLSHLPSLLRPFARRSSCASFRGYGFLLRSANLSRSVSRLRVRGETERGP